MPTLAIDLPQAAYDKALTTPERERQQIIEEAFFEWTPEPLESEANAPLTEEDLASIAAGLEDIKAGRMRPLDEFLQEIDERYGWTK